MKIFSINQIRALDQYTIENEPIPSIDLMERAAEAAFRWIYRKHNKTNKKFIILCGKGNNGGDGLVVGRLLFTEGLPVQILYTESEEYSDDFTTNLNRAKSIDGLEVYPFSSTKDIPRIHQDTIIIDALLGTGITGTVKGAIKSYIDHVNHYAHEVISIDTPSGFNPEGPTLGSAIHADYTLTFESAKLGFLFPENAQYVGQFVILPIGLSPARKAALETDHFLVDPEYIQSKIKVRNTYDHKGIFGHALMIMGSYGKMGAAVLSAKACIRSGIGLLTMHLPKCGYQIMQIAVPEAMVQTDEHDRIFTGLSFIDHYDVVAVGCGLGKNIMILTALSDLIKAMELPMVIDADALNIISENQALLESIPKKSILTPHMKEFSRLFGETNNSFERLELQKAQSHKLGIYILLKGAHSVFTTPEGKAYFNNTGNPGMATAGSGDVLTGIITALAGQGYTPQDAGIIGMHIHGLAGDVAAETLGHESLIASDIVDHLGMAFNYYHQNSD